jgi:triosephosphate isomerase
MAKANPTKLIVANWKMYKTIDETKSFLHTLKPLIVNSSADTWIAVPFTSIKAAKQETADSSILIGAQNMNDASEGAFTGEIAAKMLVDAGASFVLIGHSERRHYFKEDNAFINRKIQRALDSGLRPVLCIGETQDERNNGDMEDVLATQLSECLAGIDKHALSALVIAYEPVWAIGTGVTATPEMASEAHTFCREYLAQHWGSELAQNIPLLYGGSAKPDNATALLSQKDIDGLLIGGASLDPHSFAAIVNSVTPANDEQTEIHET